MTLVLLLALLQGGQRGERPLPVFQVVTAEGAAVSSAQLTSEPQYLIVYVNAASATSRKLLDALGEWATPELARRTVMVIGGTPQEAQRFIESGIPESLQGMTRYFDAGRSAWQALSLRGSPVLIGVRDGKTEWSLSGVLGDPDALKSVVLTWVNF
ncbi:MAG TPA: hypothetical protein VFV51_02245 [Vicinamibacterales bacterium]|nr:hypothetical protein [Vicinamibacterales bacterium]